MAKGRKRKSRVIRSRPVHYDIKCPNTWNTLKETPPGGRRGLLVRKIPPDMSLKQLVEYFENQGDADGIAHLFTMVDGVFLDFHNENVVDHVLEKYKHFIRQKEVSVHSKVVPEMFSDRFLMKTSRDMQIKYLKWDFEGLTIPVRNIDEFTPRLFTFSLTNPAGNDESEKMEEKFKQKYDMDVCEILPLRKADCLMVKVEPEITEEILNVSIENLGKRMQITEKVIVRNDCALVFFGNFADAEQILEQVKTDPLTVDGQEVKITRYLPQGFDLHEECTSISSLCEQWKGSDESTTPVSSHLDAVHTWYSLPPDLKACNERGILIPNMSLSTPPDKFVEYFGDESLSRGGGVLDVIAMIDGLFFTFRDPGVTDRVLMQKTHEIDGQPLCIFAKTIPEYFCNRLLMKKSPQGMTEDLQRLTLGNCSLKGKRPKQIKRLGLDSSLIEYGNDTDLSDMKEVRDEAKRDPDTQELQVTLLSKTDCLKIKMVKGSSMKAAKPIFESQIPGGKITRFDQTTSDTGLLYFTNYKDVENLSLKFHEKSIEFGEHKFELEPYYHCFSSEHNRLLGPNSIDTYYRKYLEGIQKDIPYPIEDEEKYRFLLQKETHMKVLQRDLDKFGNVTLDRTGPNFIISPLLVSSGDDDGDDDDDDDDDDNDYGDVDSDSDMSNELTFESTCFEKVQSFLGKFVCKHQDLDREKLKEVRKMAVDAKIASDYDGSDQENISVVWNGNTVKVVGIEEDVESFIRLMIQLVDITNNCMDIEPEKYSRKHHQKIGVKPHSIAKHAIADYFLKDDGELVLSASSHARCTILVEGGNWPTREENESFMHSSLIEDDFVFELGHLTISVVQSNILWDDSDAVVCVKQTRSSDEDPLPRGKIRIESVADLPNKKFLHVLIHEDEVDVEDYIQSLLEEAENLKCKSISMPALGTSGSVDHKQAAEMMLQAVSGFVGESKDTNLLHIKVLIRNPVKFKDFTDGLVVDKAETLQRHRSSKKFPSKDTMVTMTEVEEKSESSQSSDDDDDDNDPAPPEVSYAVEPEDVPVFMTSQSRNSDIHHNIWTLLGLHTLHDTSDQSPATISSCDFGSFKVSLRQGSITDESNDMIINSLGSCFSLSAAGEVSSAILRQGGQSIQDELDNASGSLIRVTDGGNLRCKKILHLATPGDITQLKDCIIKCLKEAEKQQMTSVSFPAVGTGGLGIPSKLVAKQMFYAVQDFTRAPPHHLKVIDIVIFQKGMVSDFERYFPRQDAPKRPKKLLSSGQIGSLTVSIQLGDITDDDNDVVVNSVGPNFDLSNGEISEQILRKAGRGLQREVSLETGDEMRVTKACGSLFCKKILHLVTPNESGKLRIAIQQALLEADKQKSSSISFPALGTGRVGLDNIKAAAAMSAAIKSFAKRSPAHLKKIDIVLLESSKANIYQTEIFKRPAPVRPKIQVIRHTKRARKGRKGRKKDIKRGREKTLVLDSVRITIREGDLIYEKSDIIVNNAVQSFDISRGKIPRKSYGAQRSEIKSEIEASSDKELRVTSSGDLRCKNIFHVVFPDTPEGVKASILRIFQEMEDREWDSFSMLPPTDETQSASILDAVVEFGKARSSRARVLAINVVAAKENIFDHLHDVIIVDGGKLPGAKVLYRPTVDVVKLLLCCDPRDGSIDEAIKKIENKVKDSYDRTTIPCEDIATLRDRSWDKIEEIQYIHRVKITVEKNAYSKALVVEGMKEGVWNAREEILSIQSKISEAANIMKLGLYYWQYKGIDGKWCDFGALENKTLEELHQSIKTDATDKEMLVDGENHYYEIDIKAMKMTGYRNVLIRRDVIEEFPKNWDDMGSETFKSVQLDPSSQEYKRVKDKFQGTMEDQKNAVVSISRIQNKNLFGVFERRKKAVALTCRQKKITRKLFHGTAKTELVCKYGFDRSYSAVALFGSGNYFAVEAHYSATRDYCKSDKYGVYTIILADVITGDFVAGKEGMFATPQKPWAPHVLYESLVENISNPGMFIVFNDASAYPSYVLKFTM